MNFFDYYEDHVSFYTSTTKTITNGSQKETCSPWRISISMRGIPIASAATAIDVTSFLRVFSTTPFTSLQEDVQRDSKVVKKYMKQNVDHHGYIE